MENVLSSFYFYKATEIMLNRSHISFLILRLFDCYYIIAGVESSNSIKIGYSYVQYYSITIICTLVLHFFFLFIYLHIFCQVHHSLTFIRCHLKKKKKGCKKYILLKIQISFYYHRNLFSGKLLLFKAAISK